MVDLHAMLSFRNCALKKRDLVQRITEAIASGELDHQNGRKCFVAIAAGSYNHERLEQLYGLPEWLGHVVDRFTEPREKDVADQFCLDLIAALPEGVNMDRVRDKFLIAILKDEIWGPSSHGCSLEVKRAVDFLGQCLSIGKADETDLAWCQRSLRESIGIAAQNGIVRRAQWQTQERGLEKGIAIPFPDTSSPEGVSPEVVTILGQIADYVLSVSAQMLEAKTLKTNAAKVQFQSSHELFISLFAIKAAINQSPDSAVFWLAESWQYKETVEAVWTGLSSILLETLKEAEQC